MVARRLLPMLLVVACSRPPSLPPGWTTAESAQFQRDHDTEVGAEIGPLSAIASHYVGPGDTLTLGVVDGSPSVTPSGDGPRVRIEVTDEGGRCIEGCGASPVELQQRRTATLGRFSLAISPQSGTVRVVVHDPLAPSWADFEGLAWFAADARFIVPASFAPDPRRPTVELTTSRGLTKPLVKAGVLTVEVLGETVRLTGYQAGAEGSALLVPLTDRTTGDTSYPVGRYLQVDVPVGGVPVVDFNRATNPWCAYSEHYNCPVPPAENRIELALHAGEQQYGRH